MADQLGANFTVDFKVESVEGTAPGASGATRLRLLDSPGINTKMAEIQSAERRADLLDTLPALGSPESPGTYEVENIVGAHDQILEALWRSTFVAPVAITVDGAGALTSFTVNSTSTFTLAGSTTPIVAGLRVGDVFRFTNMSNALNNNINLRVKSIAAGLVTVHGTPLTVQGADTAATLTIIKKLINGATPTRRTFYIEQRYVDAGASQLFPATRFVSMNLVGAPDGMARMTVGVLSGMPGQVVSGSAYYSSPTVPTGRPLSWADAVLSFDGSDVAKASAFNLTYTIAANAGKFLGTGSTGSPTYDNKATLNGSITVARQDLAYVTKYLAKTPLELHVMLLEPEAEPKDCLVIHVPNFILTGAEAPLGGDSFMPETRTWRAGVKEGAAATGYDASMVNLWTSAP